MSASTEPSSPESTIAAVVTPRGQGGIGVIQVVGVDAQSVVSRVFRATKGKNLTSTQPNGLRHGFIVPHDASGECAAEVIDEVIVRVGGPEATWLSEPFLEINCHGGIAAVHATLDALIAAGAQPARWEDLPRRALRRGRVDRVRVEAWLALPSAKTRLAAEMLVTQLSGELSRAVADAVETARRDALADLLATAPLGIALCRPPRVVIAGRPNVGKSSLFNALLSEDRALVHEQPGTTRDYVSAFIDIRGVPFELIDTAGVRPGSHPVEASGIELTKSQIQLADLVLLLRDGTRPLGQEDADLLEMTSSGTTVLVRTKADLPPAPEHQSPPGLEVSALTGHGLAALEHQLLIATLGTDAPHCEGPIIFTDRQQHCLEQALAASNAAELRQALHSLLRAMPTPPSSQE